MDTRPYDSSNTINTRARLRLCSLGLDVYSLHRNSRKFCNASH